MKKNHKLFILGYIQGVYNTPIRENVSVNLYLIIIYCILIPILKELPKGQRILTRKYMYFWIKKRKKKIIDLYVITYKTIFLPIYSLLTPNISLNSTQKPYFIQQKAIFIYYKFTFSIYKKSFIIQKCTFIDQTSFLCNKKEFLMKENKKIYLKIFYSQMKYE